MRIFIADRQPRVRYGLRVLLEQQPGWKVSGEAANVQELLESIQDDCPDLILLDWELPGTTAPDLLLKLRTYCPNLFVVSMSAHPSAQQLAKQAGADDFASKIEPAEKLIGMIHKFTRTHSTIESR